MKGLGTRSQAHLGLLHPSTPCGETLIASLNFLGPQFPHCKVRVAILPPKQQ